MTLIELFLYKDRRAKNLLNVLKYMLSKHPDIKVKAYNINISDPSEFKKYVFLREEYWSGYGTLFLRKYDIKRLPAIIVDGEKVLEGKFPTIYELKNIINRVLFRQFVRKAEEHPVVEVETYTPRMQEDHEEKEEKKSSCLQCIYFLRYRNKCLKYNITVKDYNHPPCLR